MIYPERDTHHGGNNDNHICTSLNFQSVSPIINTNIPIQVAKVPSQSELDDYLSKMTKEEANN